MKNEIQAGIMESMEVKKAILSSDIIGKMESAAQMIVSAFKSGKKVLLAGNGGSASQASHFAAEFVGRYKKEKKGLPAIALTADSSLLTAWSNDYDYTSVFERQLQAFGNAGDVFVAISTSGNSENVLRAVREAKRLGMKVINLLGKGGGRMKGTGDIDMIIPSDNTPVIQENHLMAFHIICEIVDNEFSN
ncbi:D-sedoheptulose 7-phosphate isomerase [Candidatus Woesearchaeota archaeon]|nr:D-sedoheptulose 7-phosphate isomerase [Candidatus Woesearchaeota archaeon]